LLRSGRKLVALLVTLSAVAASLALVTIGRAGSTSGTFTLFEAPVNLTAGQQGLAGAKFTPQGSGSSGSATHVVISLTIANASSLTIKSCPGGTGSVSGTTATCTISSLKNGTIAKFFVTFIAATFAAPTPSSVTGNVNWDAGGGSAGQSQNQGGDPALFTIYPTDTTINGFAGACANGRIAPGSVVSNDPATGKGGSLSSNDSAAPSTGFPCTPGYIGVEETTIPGLTPGVWNILVAPLASNGQGLAQAQLTTTTISGSNWRTTPLYEIGANNSTTKVDDCVNNAMPKGDDVCIFNRTKTGQVITFYLNVLGSSIDPRIGG
jgi:hypothetical protein